MSEHFFSPVAILRQNDALKVYCRVPHQPQFRGLLVGERDGSIIGDFVGALVGCCVLIISAVVGLNVGSCVGELEGLRVGAFVGSGGHSPRQICISANPWDVLTEITSTVRSRPEEKAEILYEELADNLALSSDSVTKLPFSVCTTKTWLNPSLVPELKPAL